MKKIIKELSNSKDKIDILFNCFDIEQLNKLPSIKIEGTKDIEKLPKKLGGLYFLLGKKNELLYVGKAFDFNKRWKRIRAYPGTVQDQHHCFSYCMERTNVTISWLELSPEISYLAEPFFIRKLNPSWNITHNDFPSFDNISYVDQIKKAQYYIGKKIRLFKTITNLSYLPPNKKDAIVTDIFFSNKSIFDVKIKWDNLDENDKNIFIYYPKYDFYEHFYFL